MPISLAINSLRSRVIRRGITSNGIRSIRRGRQTNEGILQSIRGLLDRALSFGGWLITNVFGGIQWSARRIFDLIVGTARFIFNFNWNVTDEELDQQTRNRLLGLTGSVGGLLGQSIGWLVCGAVPAATVLAFNEPLGLYLLEQVGEEALDEISGTIQALVQQTARTAAQAAFNLSFKNFRHTIKLAVRDENTRVSRAVRGLLGDRVARGIDAWGEPGSQHLSFRVLLDNAIESIPNPFLQNFTEEAVDEFLDGCVEAGYAVAGGIDSWIAQRRLEELQNQQTEELEIIPNTRAPQERLIVRSSVREAPEIITEQLSQHSQLENRDIGQFVGDRVLDYVRAAPVAIQLKLIFYNKPEPPFQGASNPNSKMVTYTVSDVTRENLTWARIRRACGGSQGYLYGPWIARAKLSNGRQQVVHGGNEEEAERRLMALLELTNVEILDLRTIENRSPTSRRSNPRRFNQPIQVFPAYLSILNQQRVIGRDEGYPLLDGNFSRRRGRFPLWQENEPEEFQAVVSSLFIT